MKVVFLESIEGTAIVGDVKVVKNGFARNYLLPRGLAGPAKEPYLTRAKAGAEREAIKQMALDKDANVVAEKLEGQKVSLIAKVGEQGKLYGSITRGDQVMISIPIGNAFLFLNPSNGLEDALSVT